MPMQACYRSLEYNLIAEMRHDSSLNLRIMPILSEDSEAGQALEMVVTPIAAQFLDLLPDSLRRTCQVERVDLTSSESPELGVWGSDVLTVGWCNFAESGWSIAGHSPDVRQARVAPSSLDGTPRLTDVPSAFDRS